MKIKKGVGMELKQIEQIKKEYYTNNIINKIFHEIYNKDNKQINRREVALLNKPESLEYYKVAFRMITFDNPNYFKKTFFEQKFKSTNIYESSANLYCSVARLKRLPNFPFKNRTKWTSKFHQNGEYEKHILHYDLYFDFDIFIKKDLVKVMKNKYRIDINKDYSEKSKKLQIKERKILIKDRMNEFLKDILKLIDLLKENDIKFQLVFSGNKGFKVLIKNNYYKPHTIKVLGSKIIKKLGLNYTDESNVYNNTKLMKINYSLCINEIYPRICMPLSDLDYIDIFKILNDTESFNYFNYSSYIDQHIVLDNHSYFKLSSDEENIKKLYKRFW